MSQSKSSTLYVYMNNLRVGTLSRLHTGELEFQYDTQWLNHSGRRPISLSLAPLTEIPFTGVIVDNFFDNLLPDNENIRRRLRARFKASSTQCFDLLSKIGADCVGAIQLLTEAGVANQHSIQATPIDDAKIANMLRNYQTAPLGMSEDTDFRISIAGAQEKTALLWFENQWQLPQGTTPTSHIIKLPIGKIQHSGLDLTDSVENEWLCLQILAAYGLPVSQVKMALFEDIKTLVVERFDRKWENHDTSLLRLPQEDMCQALGIFSDLKYESDGGPGITTIMKLLSGTYNPISDRSIFMKTVFLFWVLGAIDGHAKNFSIFLEAGGRYRLTPIYDVMSAYPLLAKGQMIKQKLKMAMSLKSKNRHYHWHEIQLRHWLSMAAICQFDATEMQRIIDEVFDDMETVISQVTEQLPKNFPQYISQAIFANMRNLKLHALKSNIR